MGSASRDMSLLTVLWQDMNPRESHECVVPSCVHVCVVCVCVCGLRMSVVYVHECVVCVCVCGLRMSVAYAHECVVCACVRGTINVWYVPLHRVKMPRTKKRISVKQTGQVHVQLQSVCTLIKHTRTNTSCIYIYRPPPPPAPTESVFSCLYTNRIHSIQQKRFQDGFLRVCDDQVVLLTEEGQMITSEK